MSKFDAEEKSMSKLILCGPNEAKQQARKWSEVVGAGFDQAKEIHILVGPEGGFGAAEVNQALESNFIPVQINPNILRAETAAIAAATLINSLTY